MVWAAIIAGTCLLLLVFQKVLWLVVPFLLALILYYFLYPVVRALIYRGMSRNAAASLVTLAFLVLVGVVGVALMPRLTSQLTHWQDTVDRYVEGGTQLLDTSLRSLERHSPPLARARTPMPKSTQEYIERVTCYVDNGCAPTLPPLLPG